MPRVGPAEAEREHSVSFIHDGAPHLLVLPAWFDEANKTRHFTVEVMRRLHSAGWSTTLPDLPGCNESLASLEEQDLASWRRATARWLEEIGATHCLAIRNGAAIVPPGVAGWRYAPLAPKTAIRAMLRARILAAREAGKEEVRDELIEQGKAHGLELAGYRLSAQMFRDLVDGELPEASDLADIKQGEVGVGALWLRAEPDFDAAQADRLAEIIGSPEAA